MVMARELYALLMPNVFRLPNNLGNAAVYTHPTVAGQPINNTPLMQAEQATINTRFAHDKHYFLLMRNISGHASPPLMQASMTPSRCPTIRQYRDGVLACE
jgi:hypothetical protein